MTEHLPPRQSDYHRVIKDISYEIAALPEIDETDSRRAAQWIGQFRETQPMVTESFLMHAYHNNARLFEPMQEEDESGVEVPQFPLNYHTKAAMGGMLFAYAVSKRLVEPLHRKPQGGKNFSIGGSDALSEEQRSELQHIAETQPTIAYGRFMRILGSTGLELIGTEAAEQIVEWAGSTYNRSDYHGTFALGFGFQTYATISTLHDSYEGFYDEHDFFDGHVYLEEEEAL